MADTHRPAGETDASEPTCPECGGEVTMYPTCHTWPRTLDDGTEQWMACHTCGSAYEWTCVEEVGDDQVGCGWSWVDGLNPRNPRSADNEASRPGWSANGRSVASRAET